MTRRKKIDRYQGPRPARVGFTWVALLSFLVFLSVSAKLFFRWRSSEVAVFDRYNLVLTVAKQVYLLSLGKEQADLWVLPAEERVTTARGYGEYRLGKVYALGELEGKGGQLLRETVQKFWSVPVFGYLRVDSSPVVKAPERGLVGGLVGLALKGQAETNLSKFDLLVLSWRLRALSDGKVVEREWSSGSLEIELTDRRLRNDQLTIEIVNASERPGLAKEAARLVQNSGGLVVRLADAPQVRQECYLEVDSEARGRYTVYWLEKVFVCPVGQLGSTSGRAAVTLVLGRDYWKKLEEGW